jgi:putative flippase GtrA
VASPRVIAHISRWAVFNLVGCAGFVVQIAILAWLTRVWGWHYLAATGVAMETVILQNYLAHSRWTWADRPATTPRERLMRPLRYQSAKTVSLGLNLTLTALFVSRAGFPPEAANLLAVLVCAVLNYAAADRLVFRDVADPLAGRPPLA